MHIKIAALAGLLMAQSLATPSFAQGGPSFDTGSGGVAQSRTGTITYLDPVTMNFVCQDGRQTQRYWVTRATRFSGPRPGVSFFDLAVGRSVRVIFHQFGRQEIADAVFF